MAKKQIKDRGCKAFPYRLTCRDSVTWHEVKESARRYAEREGLKGCAIERLNLETEEYEEV